MGDEENDGKKEDNPLTEGSGNLFLIQLWFSRGKRLRIEKFRKFIRFKEPQKAEGVALVSMSSFGSSPPRST